MPKNKESPIPFDIAKKIAEHIKKIGKRYRITIIPAGSVRREKDVSGDIDLIVTDAVDKDDDFIDFGFILEETAGAKVTTKKPNRKQHVKITLYGIEANIDLFYVRKEEMPFALMHYTGSKTYNIRIRFHAKTLGFKLNQYGLFYIRSGKRVKGSEKIRDEKQLCRFLGVTYKEPKDRSE